MAYFTPQRMTYCEALVSSQIAWDVFNQLGQESVIALQSQIINYENPFVRSLRRCDQTLNKLLIIRSNLNLYKNWVDFQIKEVKDHKTIWNEFRNKIQQSKMEGYLYINHIEDDINHSHDFLVGQLKQMEHSNKRIADVIYQMALLVTLANQNTLQIFYRNPLNPLDEGINDKSSLFESKCICINRKDLIMLKRGLFRITRGNCWVHELQINTEQMNRYFNIPKHKQIATKLLSNRLACFVMYQKGQRNIILNKINKFFGCFEGHVLIAQFNNIKNQLPSLQRKINELEAMEELTLQSIKKHVDKLCEVREGSTVSWLSYMEMYTKKEKQIYRALSTTHVSKNLVRFNLYIPSKQLPLTIQPKINLPPLILNVMQSKKMPPSKFDTNKMLEIPQQIVNIYGVPSYSEINPAPFYIITFGFFIGVMFGDVGHMLMAIPLLLHFKANIWYWTVVFFMGYCGLIYNQFFGLNLGLFDSCYTIYDGGDSLIATPQNDCVYKLGIDSVWKVAQNEMAFTNSLKMKVAVILGVVHMIFGLLIKLYNNLRQKQYLDIFTLTIPQLIFMGCTFAYMDYLIIYKWCHIYPDSKTAPSIISTMIAVFVNLAKQNPKDYLFWPSQRSAQKIIVTIALICVPIMLLGKILVICWQRKKISHQKSEIELHQLAQQHDSVDFEEQHEKYSNEEMKKQIILPKKQEQQHESLQQIAVHQFIETIEFVLGSVSNTASYLRLWALSLAHAQLSTVIFQLTILKMLEGGYSKLIGLFLIFPFFFTTTFGVLICMDSLECFLHSLRLHWVEFQNKFYQGRGYLFQPFSFDKIK